MARFLPTCELARDIQTGLSQVAAFIKTNQKALGSTLQHTSTALSAIVADQNALIQTFDTAPVGFQNVNNALDLNAPCPGSTGKCPAASVVVNTTSDAPAIAAKYCGNLLSSFTPILESSAGLGGASALDTLCAAELGLLQGQPGAPGAPHSPDLGLSSYLGR